MAADGLVTQGLLSDSTIMDVMCDAQTYVLRHEHNNFLETNNL